MLNLLVQRIKQPRAKKRAYKVFDNYFNLFISNHEALIQKFCLILQSAVQIAVKINFNWIQSQKSF